MVRIVRKDDCSGKSQLKCLAWVSERKWTGVRGNLDKRRLYRLVVDGETRWKGYDIAEVVFQKHLGQILPGESESLEHRHNGIWKSSGPLKTQICCLKPWFFEQFAPPGMVQPVCTHD